MDKLTHHRWVWLPCLLAALALACTFGSPAKTQKPAASGNGTPEQAGNPLSPTQPGASGESRGPGSFDLETPEAGLDSLQAYQATLMVGFKGEQGGAQAQWNERLTLVVSRADRERLLSVEGSGTPDAPPMAGWLNGTAGGLVYARLGMDAPCSAGFAEGPDAAALPEAAPELAGMLYSVYGAESAGPDETLNGVLTAHYRFDERALGLEGQAKASGEFWVAKDGGYLLKYTLELEDPQGAIDPDTKGTLASEYELAPGKQDASLVLPPDCPPNLADAPLLPDAADVQKQPGYLAYTTATAPKDVASFYQAELPKSGFHEEGQPQASDQGAHLEFSSGSQRLTVWISGGSEGKATQVQILLETGAEQVIDVPMPTQSPQEAASTDALMRVSKALNLMTGSSGTPGVFPSYHLEMVHVKPVVDQSSGQQSYETDELSADVEGQNVYMDYSENAKVTKGYMIGEKNYLVKDGQVQEDMLGITMLWVSWPLDVIQPLTLAMLAPEANGTEDIDGRTAEVYTLDSSKATQAQLDAIKGMMMFNPAPTEAHGTMWVDQATGGLLKLLLDYEVEAKDASGAVTGTGKGHLEMGVTKVGAVQVKLP